MRIGSYITALICAAVIVSGSAGPVWLCVRADGHVGIKADPEVSCESSCSDEHPEADEHGDDDHCDDLACVTVEDNCCLDIPIGHDGAAGPVRLGRARLAESSRAGLKLALAQASVSVQVGDDYSVTGRLCIFDTSAQISALTTVVLLI